MSIQKKHGHLKETVYMEQPPGFIDFLFLDYVCLLNKSLYGLKQTSHAWFDYLSQFLLQLDFYCSKANSSFFIYHTYDMTTILLIYVDDVLVVGNDNQFIQISLHNSSMNLSLQILAPYIICLMQRLNILMQEPNLIAILQVLANKSSFSENVLSDATTF